MCRRMGRTQGTEMKLVDNWRQWPRMYSQWAFVTIGALQANVLAFMSTDQLSAAILFYPAMTWAGLISSVTTALAVSGFAGRLISQSLGPVEADIPTEPMDHGK